MSGNGGYTRFTRALLESHDRRINALSKPQLLRREAEPMLRVQSPTDDHDVRELWFMHYSRCMRYSGIVGAYKYIILRDETTVS